MILSGYRSVRNRLLIRVDFPKPDSPGNTHTHGPITDRYTTEHTLTPTCPRPSSLHLTQVPLSLARLSPLFLRPCSTVPRLYIPRSVPLPGSLPQRPPHSSSPLPHSLLPSFPHFITPSIPHLPLLLHLLPLFLITHSNISIGSSLLTLRPIKSLLFLTPLFLLSAFSRADLQHALKNEALKALNKQLSTIFTHTHIWQRMDSHTDSHNQETT